MHQAAVGFQCPDCVAEGRRSTRSGQTAYGGTPSANPALTSQILIGINLLVWLFVRATGSHQSPWIDQLALLPAGALVRLPDGSLMQVDGVADGAYWLLVTSMFTHVDVLHVGFNMLALWFLGPQLEMAIGRARFLALYLVSGLVGSAFVYWLSAPQSFTLGASGAIFGLMGGLLVVALKVRADVSPLLMWLGINVVITVLGRAFISWQGHLGGFVGGVLIALVIVYAPRSRRTLWQALGLGVVLLGVLVAIVTRTLVLT